MSSAVLVPGMAEALRAAAGHMTFLFVSIDFASQTIHVLGRDRGNIWRRAYLASEPLLLYEPRLEMYV